jgi:hypothetical protein
MLKNGQVGHLWRRWIKPAHYLRVRSTLHVFLNLLGEFLDLVGLFDQGQGKRRRQVRLGNVIFEIRRHLKELIHVRFDLGPCQRSDFGLLLLARVDSRPVQSSWGVLILRRVWRWQWLRVLAGEN